MSSSNKISKEDQQVFTDKFQNLGISVKIESYEDLVALNKNCGNTDFAEKYVSLRGWGAIEVEFSKKNYCRFRL